MPNPLIIAAALAAASAGANYMSQKQKDDAIARSLRRSMAAAEPDLKAGREAAARTEEAYGKLTEGAQVDKDALAAQFMAQQEDIGNAMTQSALRPGDVTDAVVASEGAQRRGTRRYTNKIAEALAGMSGLDQSFLDTGLAAENNMSDIRRAQTNLRGNQRLLNADLQAAAGKGAGWGTLGDVLSMAAMAYTPYALAKAPATVGGAAPTVVSGEQSVAANQFLDLKGVIPKVKQLPTYLR